MARNSSAGAAHDRLPSTETATSSNQAIVDGLPTTHRLFKEELFVPFVVVAGVESSDEARLANKSELDSAPNLPKDKKGMQTFFDQIQAGVTYANSA